MKNEVPRQGAHKEMIGNYDESVVVYGSGFVCHVEEVSAVVYGNKNAMQATAPCGVDTL